MFAQQQLRQLERSGVRAGHAAHNTLVSSQQALRAAQMFRPRSERAEYQSVNADVDGDGKEDTTSIRLLPVADSGSTAGKSLAAGATFDFELKPLKLFKGLNFVGAGAAIDDGIAILSAFVGQTDIWVAKGAVPLSGLVGARGDSNLLDLPWAGPGLSIYLTLKNISAATIVYYGGIRGLAVTG